MNDPAGFLRKLRLAIPVVETVYPRDENGEIVIDDTPYNVIETGEE
jgi:hypothetical protein